MNSNKKILYPKVRVNREFIIIAITNPRASSCFDHFDLDRNSFFSLVLREEGEEERKKRSDRIVESGRNRLIKSISPFGSDYIGMHED